MRFNFEKIQKINYFYIWWNWVKEKWKISFSKYVCGIPMNKTIIALWLQLANIQMLPLHTTAVFVSFIWLIFLLSRVKKNVIYHSSDSSTYLKFNTEIDFKMMMMMILYIYFLFLSQKQFFFKAKSQNKSE